MALIKCPGCGRDISDKAKKCPGCGWKPGNKKEIVTPLHDEGETNTQNIENINELEEEYQKNKQLEDKVIKLESKIIELNNADQEIENLKRLVKKINNEKMSLLEQINEVSSQESNVIDNIDFELRQKLQEENLLLTNDNKILQKENIDLKSINKKQHINKMDTTNIIMNFKELMIVAASLLIILLLMTIGIHWGITKLVLSNELTQLNIASKDNIEVFDEEGITSTIQSDSVNDVVKQEKEEDNIISKKEIEVRPFDPKEDGYNQGDVICEISGVSIIYESCLVDDETTMFTFKCINNGNVAYKVRAKNIAVNRIMMGGDYFTTDEITVGNQGELSFWYSNEFLTEECGDLEELNLTMSVREEYSEVDSVDGIYLLP